MLLKKIALIYIGSLLLLLSCRSPQLLFDEPMKVEVPEAFQQSGLDSSRIPTTWVNFFQDTYLLALIQEALQNNRDLHIAAQRVSQARAELLYRRAALLPAIRLHTSVGADRFGDYTLDGVGNFDTNLSGNIDDNRRIPTSPTPDYFAGLRSSWELDLWAKLRSQKRAQQARWRASEAYKQLLTTEVVAAVATAYYQLLALDSELEVVRRNSALQSTMLEMIRTQKEAGIITDLALKQAEAQWYHTQSLLGILQNQIIAQENEINFLCGRLPQPVARIKGGLQGEPLPKVSPDWVYAMLQQRPDVQQARWQVEAAGWDLRAAQLAFLPTLSLDAYMGYHSFRKALWFDPASFTYGLLAGMMAPLFQNRQLRTMRQLALAQSYEAYFNYQKTVLKAFQELYTYQQSIANLEEVYSLRSREVEALSQAILSSQALYQAAMANYLEVITTQRTVLEAELSLYEIRLQQLIYSIAFYRALGGGWR